jgi:hypothetical protein
MAQHIAACRIPIECQSAGTQWHLWTGLGTLHCACGLLISPPRHVCDIWDCMPSAWQRTLCTRDLHNDVRYGKRAVRSSIIVAT